MITLDQISAPAFMVRVDGPQTFLFIEANDALARQTGLNKQNFEHRRPEQVFSADYAAKVCGHYTACVEAREPLEYEIEFNQGTVRYWRTTLTPILDASGTRVEQLIGISLDITESRRAQEALHTANGRLTLALQALKGAHWHIDLNTHTFEASPALATLLGEPEPRRMTSEEWIARIVPEDQEHASLHYLVEGALTHQVSHFRIMQPSGELRWLRCRRLVVNSPDNRLHSIYGVTVDVTDDMLASQKLTREADLDTLTPLLNRRAFHRELDRMMVECERDGEALAVMMLDLDGFKAINDSFGHSTGDAVLIEVARRLKATTRAYDACARLGGDEFIIAARHLEPALHETMLSRLKAKLEAPFSFEGHALPIRVSAGAAAWQAGADRPGLIERADFELYADKRRGKAERRAA